MSKVSISKLHSAALDLGWIGLWLAVIVMLRAVAFDHFSIPSSSMEPGLVTGDHVLVDKFSYGWSRASLPFNPPLPGGRIMGKSPERGDVVVFRLPRDPSVVYIKRVIGLPGDKVQVRGGVVSVNGEAYPQQNLGKGFDQDAPGRRVNLVRETLPDGAKGRLIFEAGAGLPGDDTGLITVPENAYFMMGDNRDNSLDSRWPEEAGVGFVPFDNLIGRARRVMFSWDKDARPLEPWTWRLQTNRFLRPID